VCNMLGTAPPPTGVKWSAAVRGQSTVQLLCCREMCTMPVHLFVTDGGVYHYLYFRGSTLHAHKGIAPTEALDVVCNILKACRQTLHLCILDAGPVLTGLRCVPPATERTG
jgi:hypothetical protein